MTLRGLDVNNIQQNCFIMYDCTVDIFSGNIFTGSYSQLGGLTLVQGFTCSPGLYPNLELSLILWTNGLHKGGLKLVHTRGWFKVWTKFSKQDFIVNLVTFVGLLSGCCRRLCKF